MPVRITAQGCEIASADRKQAEALMERWPRFDPAVMDAKFVFQAEGHTRSVGASVSRRRRSPVVATGTGTTFRAALDDLNKHITRILKRDRERRTDPYRAPAPSSH